MKILLICTVSVLNISTQLQAVFFHRNLIRTSNEKIFVRSSSLFQIVNLNRVFSPHLEYQVLVITEIKKKNSDRYP